MSERKYLLQKLERDDPTHVDCPVMEEVIEENDWTIGEMLYFLATGSVVNY